MGLDGDNVDGGNLLFSRHYTEACGSHSEHSCNDSPSEQEFLLQKFTLNMYRRSILQNAFAKARVHTFITTEPTIGRLRVAEYVYSVN